jgi:hypothetical protein
MACVFICYRRADSSGYTRSIHDDLAAALGPDRVFMDVEAIAPGVDFVEAIRAAIGEGKVLLVIIGKKWLVDDQGRRRMEQPNDHVRVEIETALQRGMPIIPVLVDGATMPDEPELPESIRALARRNACELSNQRWKFDMDRLVSTVSKLADLPQTGTGGQTPRTAGSSTAGVVSGRRQQLRPYLVGGLTAVGLLVMLAIWMGDPGAEIPGGTLHEDYDSSPLLDGASGGGSQPVLSYGPPNFGIHALQAGFVPDPFTLNVTSGGAVPASAVATGCEGFVSENPDMVLQWSGSSDLLRIFFQGSGDATLLIQDPTGDWYCNDDFQGTHHPLVDFGSPTPGQYSVWVGSYQADLGVPGLIYVTEASEIQPEP